MAWVGASPRSMREMVVGQVPRVSATAWRLRPARSRVARKLLVSIPGWGLVSRGEQGVDVAGDEAFETADDLAAGLAVCVAAFGIGAGFGVGGEPDHRDAPEGVVRLPVAALVETMADDLAGGSFDR